MYPHPLRRTLKSAPAALIGLAASLALLPSPGWGQAAVLTQNNDNARTGANTQETVLTPAVVNVGRFGKLFTRTLDAPVNGQVLYVPGLPIGGAVRNVLIAFTSTNGNNSPCSVYAFDADDPAASTPLWRHALPTSAQWTTDTPAIDAAAGVIYLLTKDTTDSGATHLRVLDLRSGDEKASVVIAGSVAGAGDGSVGGVVTFDTSHANDRPGLLLANGNVYIAFSHNSDSFPYHGWIFGYHFDGSALTQTALFCTTPNGGEGGIWMAGKGLTADGQGNIYCSVGNGTFDASAKGITSGTDYGMCYLRLTPALSVADWFSPHDEQSLSNADQDLGGGGLAFIPGTDRLFAGGTKFGSAFVLDSTRLGKFTPGGPDDVVNRLDGITPTDSVGQNPVAWDAGGVKYVYLWANGAELEQFQYDPAVGKISPAGIYKQTSGMTQGGSLTVTSNGSGGGILWAADANGVVHAFNATDVSKPELWNSAQDSNRDALGSTGHFQFPTVANGKAYISSGDGHIVAYGLLPSTTPAQAHTLWDNANGALSLWSQDPASGAFTYNVYGPYNDAPGSVWKAQAVADGPDQRTRVLWTNPDGRVLLWTMDRSGSFIVTGVYGPYTDGNPNTPWSAVALSVGPDNVPHLLWTNPDGRAALWNVAADGSFSIAAFYGPYTDAPANPNSPWTATALATGPDAVSHLLWNNADGRVILWSVSPNGGFAITGAYGPYTDGGPGTPWRATALAAGADGINHILWDDADGKAALWSVNGQGGFAPFFYGPYTDGAGNNWTATALGVGSDNRPRIVWNNTDGRVSIFSVDAQGTFTDNIYGPYGGWSAVGVSGAR